MVSEPWAFIASPCLDSHEGLSGYEYTFSRSMKIVVTATAGGMDARVDPRYGRSRYFVSVDPKSRAFESWKSYGIHQLFTLPRFYRR